jgi:hypothetical protein
MFFQTPAFLLLSILLAQADAVPLGNGSASLYTPWIKGPTVPNAFYAGKWRYKPTPDDLVCAHRRLPFGTYLRLTNPKHPNKPAYCVVLDRGPYGACVFDFDLWLQNKKRRGCPMGFRFRIKVNEFFYGHYRVAIDATPAVHEMMGSKGWEKIIIERLRVKPSRRVLRRSDFCRGCLAWLD